MGALILFFSSASIVNATIVFNIANPSVSPDDTITVDAVVTGLTSSSNCSTSGCYLQAEILSAGGTFGYTFNNSEEFIDFFQPASVDEIKSKLFNFVPVAGSWSGKLKAKNNPESKMYYGPGQYILLFRRFTGNSKTATTGDSNSVTVNLTLSAPTPSPTPTPISTSGESPTPIALKTAPPTPAPSKSPTPFPVLPTPTKRATPSPTQTPEVLGVASDSATFETFTDLSSSPSPTPTPEITDSNKKFPLLALVFVFFGALFIGGALYWAYKKQKQNSTGILNE
ncbi:MAG TPA: hypothetical protein VKC54_05060 [Patescibacteria group bacterium]|nr:hypothetical protein [Patescibacteria group bacterium]